MNAARMRGVLGSKLQAPAPHPQQILRRQALDSMAAATAARLVLLRAPAGFGKSTLMLQYREQQLARGVACGWLTLDRADNDASRFLTGLDAAVTAMLGPDGAEPRDPASQLPPTIGDAALDILARLAAHDEPFSLFLDDFEVVTETGVLSLVREVLDNLPRGGQLVIGSRALPDLRLGRLRARGQLLEVSPDGLRFSLEETTGFFATRRAKPLAPDELALLHRKTEGWITALWLAAVALERSEAPGTFVERFSGTNQALTDYLAEEVLSRQSPQVRHFLLHTSVLKQLEAPLCNALLPDTDSAAVLQELEQAGVLIVPLGEDRRSFRYHSLFARFLRSQLQRHAPQAAPALHAAASRWYQAQGRPVPAIDHALPAGDLPRTLALLAEHASDLLAQGRMRLLTRWFGALPAGALQGHAELQLVEMWAVCFVRGPWEAMDMLQRSGLEHSTLPAVMAHVRALKPAILAIMDRYEEAAALSLGPLQLAPSGVPFVDTVHNNVLASIAAVMGEHQHARRLIDSARRGQGSNAGAFNQMYAEATEGIIDLTEGRLRQATARFRMAVSTPQGGAFGQSNGNAWAGIPYAIVVYEAGDLDQAARLLQVYLPLMRDVGLADHIILGYQALSRIAFWRGDVDDAFQQLTELEYVGHKGRLPRIVACAKLERSRLLLLQGHHHAAREEIDRADDPQLWARVERLRYLGNDLTDLAIARWRWGLHAGDALATAEALGHGAQAAQTQARRRRALKLGLLQSAALYRAGASGTALPLLESVLKSACAEGFVRLVLDEGAIIAGPLRELAQQQAANDSARNDPIFTDYVARLSQAAGSPPAREDKSDAPALMLEPLTRKEIRVLQLLAEGYSNNAMAEKLFVSDSTVRTHLRNINSKLDAHSRTQAVAAARRLGVIH